MTRADQILTHNKCCSNMVLFREKRILLLAQKVIGISYSSHITPTKKSLNAKQNRKVKHIIKLLFIICYKYIN